MSADIKQISSTIDVLFEDGDVVELRALGVPTGNGYTSTFSGYFDDFDVLAEEAAKLDRMGAEGVYITPNPVIPDLLARRKNQTRRCQKRDALTTNDEIAQRRYVLIDLDPSRPAGISSTDEEKQVAYERAKRMATFLKGEGWPGGVLADSGNGIHLIYRVDLPADDGGLTRRVLRALAGRFSDEAVKIDTAVHNAARIWKLYGTTARKGDATKDRPHRRAKIVRVADNREVVPSAKLQALAAPKKLKETRRVSNRAMPADEIQRALECIPERPDYDEWFRIIAGTYAATGGDAQLAESLLTGWSPEEKEGEYRQILNSGLDGSITAGTLIHIAKKHGFRHRSNGHAEKTRKKRAVDTNDFKHTDLGNAERLIAEHGEDLRYCYRWKSWLSWTGTHWERDPDGEVMRRAKKTVRQMRRDAAELGDSDERGKLWKHAKRSESKNRLRAMIVLARSEKGVPVKPEELNADDWLLNVNNGTVDLRRGTLLGHDRSDLITKRAPVDYDKKAACPRWIQFLYEVFDGDGDLVQYVQRAAGYAMTGSTEEQCLFVLYGTGANGKGTFINTLAYLLGEYAQATRPQLLLRRNRSSGPSEDEAALHGARLVSTSETGSGQKFDEATVKRLTGSDMIRARFLRENEFEFEPTHKIWLATNHKPVIEDTDYAIWRRIQLLPFNVTFSKEERDGRSRRLLRG